MLSYAVKAGSYFSIVFTYDDPESEMQVWKGDILYNIIYIYIITHRIHVWYIC